MDIAALFHIAPVSVVIFLVTMVISIMAFFNEELMTRAMLYPYGMVRTRNYQPLLTSGLIHADWMHLAFNMMTFYFFAPLLEFQMGHWQFLVVYMAALLLSGLMGVERHKHDQGYRALGASGAISGVVLSMVMLNPTITIGVYFIPMPGWLFALLYLGYSYYAAKHANDNIGHDAHLFGALTGIAVTIILYPSSVKNILHLIGF